MDPQRSGGDRAATWCSFWFLAASVLPALGWVIARSLSLDLWYDEIWSLRHYALQPLHHIVTDYTHPNNHVLYNLLQSLWLAAVGIDRLEQGLAAPWLVRLPSLACALLCLVYTSRLGGAWFGPIGAWLSPVVLATSMPFFHFAAQARGYALSMLLLTVLLVHCELFARGQRRRDALAIAAATAAALYVLPSNAYAVLAVAGWHALGLRRARATRPAARGILWSLFLGATAAIALYAPILDQMIEVRRSVGSGDSTPAALATVLGSFVSGRWPLVALLAAAAATRARQNGAAFAAALFLSLAPFAVAALAGDRPYARVWVVLAPLGAVALAGGAAALLATSFASRASRIAAGAVVAACCHGSFASGLADVDARLRADRSAGAAAQCLDYGYYSGPFRPGALARELRDRGATQCIFRDGDRVAMSAYLAAAGIECLGPAELPSLVRRHGHAWLVTARPAAAMKEVRARLPGAGSELVGRAPTLHRLLRVSLSAR